MRIVLAVLAVSLLGIWAVGDVQQPVIVFWNVPGCIALLEVEPPEVDLGEGVPGDVLSGINHIRVRSNCSWCLMLEAQELETPPGHPNPFGIMERFEWRTEKVTPPWVENLQLTFTTFPSFHLSMGVARANRGGRAVIQVEYKLTIDEEDVPGFYNLHLLYTLTSP